MKNEKIERLLEKYFEGGTSVEEEKQLRAFFRGEEIPDHLQSYAAQFRYMDRAAASGTDADPMAKIEIAEADASPDESRVHGATARAMKPGGAVTSGFVRWSLRVAAGTILVLAGFSAGLLLNRPAATDEDIAALQTEIRQLKNSLMYGSVRQVTASERISAVNTSTRLQDSRQLGEEITEILVYTLNNDQNVNVRLAAAEALFKFREEPQIGKALAAALPRQTDPLMQITLIDMLVSMKERSAITDMQKMLMNTETEEIVKERLQESIAELKT